jgi:ubiquinone/menaquinone biosynthesis C-methylase UbiE
LHSAQGFVLELGAGTGRNLEHYTAQVERLVLTEPDRHMRSRLSKRLVESPFSERSEICASTAEQLPFPDVSFDCVVVTLVLCSVADLRRSILEAQRVLRPGGRLLLIEHIRAPNGTSGQRWQEALEPIWPICAGGCHLTRDPRDTLLAAGFLVEAQQLSELRGAPTFLRTILRGEWRKGRESLLPAQGQPSVTH